MIVLAIASPPPTPAAWWTALLGPTDLAAATVWIATILAALTAWRWSFARSARGRG